ncbi:MAG: precorrin-2 C(20)-methyltransferase [Actinomycetota bacterium]
MRKTSVYLPDGLKRRLSELAERSHRSEADLIRSAVEHLVEHGADSSPAESPVPGRLVGVGVGPGSADLLTVRALHALRRATVVLAPCTDLNAIGRAETIVREAAPDVVVERLVFAMTSDLDARQSALDAAADRAVELLDAGEEVAFVTLGDANMYSTFSSVIDGVRTRRPDTPVVTVPGVMAFQELAAQSGVVLADDQQTFVVLPANEDAVSASDGPVAELLADPNCTLVLYKGGRRLTAIGERLDEAGRMDGATFGELLGMPGERIAPVAAVVDRPASYLSAIIVPAAR